MGKQLAILYIVKEFYYQFKLEQVHRITVETDFLFSTLIA